MTPKQEREAEAFTVWQRHGERAPLFVAERVGALAAQNDMEGVKRWQEIASELDTMMLGGRN